MSAAVVRDLPVAEPCTPEAPWRHWIRNASRVGFVSGVIGLMLTALRPSLYELVENLVYSECIGLCIYTGITGMGRLFPRGASETFTGYLVRGLVAVPLGLYAGLNLAAFLRGNPLGFAVLNDAAIYALPVTVVASAATMYFLWSRKRMAEVATANAEAQRLTAEARLKMLQAQIEPHMLFNTLANLRSLVDVDAVRAQEMIDQLIVYLRGTLAASRSATVTLADEFAQLAAYLELMRVRMAHRLRVELTLPGDLQTFPIPPMLLQPIVENAIRHGLEPKIEGGVVRVSAMALADCVRIDVEDDGVGLDDGHAAGYGLAHVHDRLHLLYADRATVAIESRPTAGVRVRIEVPR